MLFEQIIIGPIHSRRLGRSLGVNILHDKAKICTFNCVYCECGLNFVAKAHQPSRDEVRAALEQKMIELTTKNEGIDVITFAGNGEPTTHKQFPQIVDDVVELRNKYFPDAKITVLSNSTMIYKEEVRAALKKIDNNVLKLDSAIESSAKVINQPNSNFSVAKVVENMELFEGQLIVQTLFLRGQVNGVEIDNTTDKEVSAWLDALQRVKPQYVMLYSLDRKTPYDTLYKVEADELNQIAQRVEALGIKTQVTQ